MIMINGDENEALRTPSKPGEMPGSTHIPQWTSRRASLALLLLLTSVVFACAGSVAPDFSRDGFSVRAGDGQLRLENGSPAPVHYVALEEETSTRVDLMFDPEQWPSIPAGGEVSIPYGQLMGYEPGKENARIHWWTAGHYGEPVVVLLK
jgi:hypothetical protein